MAMAGLFLNPTGLPSEHPALSDSQISAQGGHVMARGGADDVTTMAGMRAVRLRCCQWSREGTLQCWCQQVLIGCSDGVVLDMVVMAMLGIIIWAREVPRLLISLRKIRKSLPWSKEPTGAGPYLRLQHNPHHFLFIHSVPPLYSANHPCICS